MVAEITALQALLDSTPDAHLLPLWTALDALTDSAWCRYREYEKRKIETTPTAPAPRAVPVTRPAEDTDLTVKEVAHRLGMSECWVRRHQTEIGCTRHGNAVRFSPRSVERYRARAERAAA
jgi:hypothetical protein